MIVLILGSGPSVVACRDWPREIFGQVVAINNAWAVRPDWDILIHPEDFPVDRHPQCMDMTQRVVTAEEYVPANNAFGGVVYAGATMAFTAGYWALQALQPRVLAFLGCDMVYGAGQTHFYGSGAADPLRADPTLQDLEAKAARLELLATLAGCATVNLSDEDSRLTFARATPGALKHLRPSPLAHRSVAKARAAEAALGAFVASGRYWDAPALNSKCLAEIDALWRRAHEDSVALRVG